MTSVGHALLFLFLFGIGTTTLGQETTEATANPCKANPCQEGNYCYALPEEEENPYRCIEDGYMYGNCSMNTVEMCAADTRCVEAADRKTYTCICEDPQAEGNGVRKDRGGSGCVLPIKECKDDKDCPQYGFCDATVGYCKCDPGFQGNGFECEDIPECDDAPCDPNAICRETPGNFTCTCDGKRNFQGDGYTCIHVCLSDNDCDPPRGKCKADSQCECKPGYLGNGTHCTDIDECSSPGLNDCPDGGYCINEIGGYDCKCKNGYFGDRKKCDALPTNCKEIENMKAGNIYIIDPDGQGPAQYFEVTCDNMWGEVVTILNPTNPQPIKVEVGDTEVDIDYQANPEDIQPLLERSGFCFQDVTFDCYRHFKMFPGTVWYDAYNNANENWATETFQTCPCGEVGTCENKCNCDGEASNKWVNRDAGKIVDRGHLPVMRVSMPHLRNVNKGKMKIDPLICMDTTEGLPKNCHDAKTNHNIGADGPLIIDVDGAGPIEPFLVNCDMKSFDHVGITEILPNSPSLKITTIEGEPVDYSIPGDKMKGLISGSAFCSQKVEFECQNSRLMGNGGAVSVGSEKRKLDYFPGANGAKDSCGCGATKSCASPEVKCNCNLDDGELKKDFGLIINKEDLPVVHVTGEFGGEKTSTYTVGPLRCAGNQFAIEPNCEKYRATGTNTDYTYFVDPDGPGIGVEPFLVECQFIPSPPQGKTILHHEDEIEIAFTADNLDLRYLDVSQPQVDALKDRSTYCSQEVKINCNKLRLQETEDIVAFKPNNGTDLMSLLPFMQSCADGNGCNCNGQDETSDNGELLDIGYIPVGRFDMAKLQSQLQNGATGSITVGPMICAEVFPTCNSLQRFIDNYAPEGEAAVINGLFTIDPDGAGGVEPFEVKCQFPSTIVPLKPPSKEVGPNPDNPEQPESQCFDIQYEDDKGNPITPEQVDALSKVSGNCRQKLTLECVSSPASGKVNFTSCDGETQKGWGGSMGEEGCACSLSGICAGGPKAKCNCDMGDDKLREDSGVIYDNDRIPICQVCLSAAPSSPGTTTSDSTPPMQKFELGQLVCDGSPRLKKSCQDARSATSFSGEEQEVPTVLSIAGENVAVSCKYTDGPPVGSMVVNPRDPVFPPPDPESPVNVTIDYVTIRIDLVKAAMNRNTWCRQKIFFFCVGGQAMETGGVQGYTDINGNVYGDWERMPADSKDIQLACDQYKELCERCGKPMAYMITKKNQLPVQSIYLDMTGVTVVVDHVECMNIRTSCQEMMDSGVRGKVAKSLTKYLIDPDGPGEISPFVAKCVFYDNWKVGITEIPLDGQWQGKVNVQGQQLPGQFEIPIEFENADTDQIRSLAQISEFCWQNIKYECEQSPLLNNGVDPASYYYLNSSDPSTSFGTDDNIDATGCACGVLGTCVNDDVSCNCDAKGPMGVDQGAITDKDVLPITQINVGGQTADSNVDVTVSPIQCGKLPITPPRSCDDARTIGSRNTIEYKQSGEYLISPSPEDTAPFMVYCDFEILPGKAVSVIKPLYPPNNTIDNPDQPEEVPYGGPDPTQIRSLVATSNFCYQGVKMECRGSQVFKGGASWLPAGSSESQSFWGGGDPVRKVCACGKDGNCGGLDSYTGQNERACNCDIGDDVTRFDAGIITQKEFLPLSEFSFGQGAKFDNVRFTFGDVICSQYEIPMNECELGFHDCDPKAKCVDLDDGYTCVCPEGWEGKSATPIQNAPRANGRECINDDECSWKPCSHFATCTNTAGSFFCTCKPGFRAVDETTCVDIDECKENADDCHEDARCENLVGSYRCACRKGYRGDGKQCRAVGECKCFGDPHCLSFDSRWLHYQGLCEYVMSKDKCESGGQPSYQVLTKYWRRGSTKPGYYSYVESVRILLNSGDLEIKLIQNLGILINGIQVDQYINPDGVTALKYSREIVVRAPNGLEVSWDGKDAVTIVVPENRKEDTCGMCGNYNGDPKDDWMVGETCEGREGTVTDNFELFGNSWTVMNNSEVTCSPDCDPEVPPDPRDCERKELIEYECSKLLDMEDSPFKECLAMMSNLDIDQFKMSCSYDLCFVDADFKGAVCSFAETINKECTDKYKTRITEWRDEVEYCEPGSCENNMKYKTCGPVSQETCMTLRVDVPVEDNPDECYEGCFCAEGLVMEADKCIPKDDCGCLYNNQYIQRGEIVVNPNCETQVKCEGGDQLTTSPVSCGDNEECRLEGDGIVDCFCVEGYFMNERGDECIKDPCYNVTCEEPNTECFKGECHCQMGYIGNCNSCQDLDECATGADNCNRLGQRCRNLPGSFECECEAGFIPGTEGNCEDIDECEIFAENCGSNSECTNTLGSYSCECCAGYKKNDGGDCIRDLSLSKRGKCCACKGDKCVEPGKVCGSDAVTYNDYRSLAVISCRKETEVKVDYPGECQPNCETVQCKIPYQSCEMDPAGKPSCGCPTCEDSSFESISDTVCATNKITYKSICHMKAATCEAELEIQVEVETVGKPCPPGDGGGDPGPWTDWGECSEPCKQGTMTRTRTIPPGSGFSEEEEVSCFSTCPDGPCTTSTCESPAQVCTANALNATSCDCPECADFPEDPVCGRVGTVIQTFDNQCELQAEACNNGVDDFELLEPRACEDKPKDCGKIRKFHLVVDDNGCKADRTLNFADCYGGCDTLGDKCCYPIKKEEVQLIMSCPNGSFHRRSEEVITECKCIDNSEAEALRNQENPEMTLV